VPLGEGIADIKGILSQVHQAGLKPLFSIEYERDFDNPMAQMVPSVNYFNKVCGELLAKQVAVPANGK
jgi:sugar phosphate isomerase/epimerase